MVLHVSMTCTMQRLLANNLADLSVHAGRGAWQTQPGSPGAVQVLGCTIQVQCKVTHRNGHLEHHLCGGLGQKVGGHIVGASSTLPHTVSRQGKQTRESNNREDKQEGCALLNARGDSSISNRSSDADNGPSRHHACRKGLHTTPHAESRKVDRPPEHPCGAPRIVPRQQALRQPYLSMRSAGKELMMTQTQTQTTGRCLQHEGGGEREGRGRAWHVEGWEESGKEASIAWHRWEGSGVGR